MPAADKFPSGPEKKVFGIEDWGSLNTKAQRPAIEDNQLAWVQNFMPIGKGNLRTLYGNGDAIFTSLTGQIVSHYEYNIGTSNYAIVFLADGSAIEVNTDTAVQTVVGAAGTFYAGGTAVPAIAQWGSKGILIVSTISASAYWAWDHVTLYPPGVASPAWLNGGTPTTMPSGISGTYVEVYQSRAWVGNASTVSFSAPSNGANFSGAAGGGSFTSNDSFLRASFTAIKQANGFLYLVGDSSVNVISNVQTSGTPLTTTFNNQNVDPQVGTAWPGCLQAFGRGLVYANPTGVYALYGGAAEKVSDALDGLFSVANFTSGVRPTGAVATIFGIRVYCLLITAPDQHGTAQNVMCMWDGKKWFLGTQDVILAYINTQEINSNLSCWASTGTQLVKCFTTPSSTLVKSFQTKLWAGSGFILQKQAFRFYSQLKDIAGSGVRMVGTIDADISTSALTVSSLNAINNTGGQLQAQNIANQNIYPVVFGNIAVASSQINWTNSSGGIIYFTNSTGGIVYFTVAALYTNYQDVAAYGNVLGFTIGTQSPDFTIITMALLYRDHAPLGG